MSHLKKLSMLALAIGVSLAAGCSNKPITEPIKTNPNFYGVDLDKGYFSYYYDYDMSKSVASGEFDKPMDGVNTEDFDHIEYKFTVDGEFTYLDLVFNYKTKEVFGKPFFVDSVNDTEGKKLSIVEKNRKVETCRAPGQIGTMIGSAREGCWITEKIQVVYPSYPNDPPLTVGIHFRNHEQIGLDFSRKYIDQLQELSAKLKKKRIEIKDTERYDGLARLNLIDPTPKAVVTPVPVLQPITTSQPVYTPVVQTYPVAKPIKTAVVKKPVKKAPVKQAPKPKKVYKHIPKKVAADCPPVVSGSFTKTVVKKPVAANPNRKVDVYIDNRSKLDEKNATVIKQPVKIIVPEGAK